MKIYFFCFFLTIQFTTFANSDSCIIMGRVKSIDFQNTGIKNSSGGYFIKGIYTIGLDNGDSTTVQVFYFGRGRDKKGVAVNVILPDRDIIFKMGSTILINYSCSALSYYDRFPKGDSGNIYAALADDFLWKEGKIKRRKIPKYANTNLSGVLIINKTIYSIFRYVNDGDEFIRNAGQMDGFTKVK